GCKSLEIVNLPEDLIKIGDGAFRDCVSLERINVYDECDYIADNAFDGCDKLTICGMKGSYAEQYANKHDLPFEELDTTIQSVN
ncbi:leucine-rich repeat protein, partial [Pseudomonas aeruginosa]